jgi:YjbE family integral membrane protein
MDTQTLISILQIIWIDLLLSGDNAVVIALACRSLPARQRKMGIILGASAAVVLRILFALVITQLLALPFLKLVGGALLLWVAVKLMMGDEEAHDVASSESLWRAVRTIVIADAVMSLDNVVAIAAAARGDVWLFVFGLALSVPLIVAGSTLLTTLLTRFPVLVWAGAALLGWIAGEMIVTDPWLAGRLGFISDTMRYGAATLGAAACVAIGFLLARRAGRGAAKTV